MLTKAFDHAALETVPPPKKPRNKIQVTDKIPRIPLQYVYWSCLT